MNEKPIPSSPLDPAQAENQAASHHREARRTVAPFAEATEDNASALQEQGHVEVNEASLDAQAPAEGGEDTLSFGEAKPEASVEGENGAALHEAIPEDDSEKKDGANEHETEEKAASEERDAVRDVPKKKNQITLSPAGNVFDWIKSFLFSLTAVIFIFTLLFRGVTVNGGSMLPTLQNGEYLIISDLMYTPKSGDIVVVQSPSYKNGTEPLIKRVIATGGQTVRINFSTWEVWVDDQLLSEDYILRDGASMMNPEDLVPDEDGTVTIEVEENCIFVMGDHRNDSLDSRSQTVGQIDEHYIMGRVLLRITPPERFGKVD